MVRSRFSRNRLTIAPIAPWFTPTQTPDGGYATVWKNVGAEIDFLNVQFYNQEGSYETCDVSRPLPSPSSQISSASPLVPFLVHHPPNSPLLLTSC